MGWHGASTSRQLHERRGLRRCSGSPQPRLRLGCLKAPQRKTLKGAIRRGSCASTAEAVLNSGRGRLRTAVLATGMVPPPVVRLIDANGSDDEPCAGPGTPAWHTRRGSMSTPSAPRAALVCDIAGRVTPDSAAQEACPPAVLARAASDPEWEVRARVASNHNSGSGVLSLLVHDDDPDIVEAVADNPTASLFTLVTVARYGHFEAVEILDQNRNFEPVVLAATARNPDEDVREFAARHHFCPEQTLAVLARDRDTTVCAAVAANEYCPSQTLAVLAANSDEDVQLAVARNQSSEDDAAETLTRSLDGDTVRHVHMVEVVGAMADNDSSAAMRRAAAGHELCPTETLGWLAESDGSDKVRVAAAGNWNCEPSTLAMLAYDRSRHVRATVASNPASGPDTLTRLAQTGYEDQGVRDAAAATLKLHGL